jgi:hypothetical protein
MPIAQTFDRRTREETDPHNPDLKILIMNFDPTTQNTQQQSNPTTPHTGLLSSPNKIFNSLRTSNNGISPKKVMQMNDAAMSISNHIMSNSINPK